MAIAMIGGCINMSCLGKTEEETNKLTGTLVNIDLALVIGIICTLALISKGKASGRFSASEIQQASALIKICKVWLVVEAIVLSLACCLACLMAAGVMQKPQINQNNGS